MDARGLGPARQWGGGLAPAELGAPEEWGGGSTPQTAPTPADRPRRAGARESGVEHSPPTDHPPPLQTTPRGLGAPGVGRRARPPRTAVRPPRRPAPGVSRTPPGPRLRARPPATPRSLCRRRRRPLRPALRGATSGWRRLGSDSPRAAMRVGNPKPGGPPTPEVTRGEQPEAGRPKPAGGDCSH